MKRNFSWPGFAVLLGLVVAGCAQMGGLPPLGGPPGGQPPPVAQTYRDAVLEAGIAYSTAARAALVYAQQPRCGLADASAAPFCADALTVARLGQASKAARAALRAAQGLADAAAPAAQAAALAAVADALGALVRLRPAGAPITGVPPPRAALMPFDMQWGVT